jgi:YD repeat-containing protein
MRPAFKLTESCMLRVKALLIIWIIFVETMLLFPGRVFAGKPWTVGGWGTVTSGESIGWGFGSQGSALDAWLALYGGLYVKDGSCGDPDDPSRYRFCPILHTVYGTHAGVDVNLVCFDDNGDPYVSPDGSCLQYYVMPDPEPIRCSTKSGPLPLEANPCSPATGNKVQTETDFSLSNGALAVRRYYSSRGTNSSFEALGSNWQHNYGAHLDSYVVPDYDRIPRPKSSLYLTPDMACTFGWNELKGNAYLGVLADGSASYDGDVCKIQKDDVTILVLPIRNTLSKRVGVFGSESIHVVNQSNGNSYTFRNQGDWQPVYPSRATLAETQTGWIFTDPGGVEEVYDTDGYLLSSKDRNNQITTFTYNVDGDLETVTGPFGDTLVYHYTDGRITSITTPEGDLGYGYDAEGRLSRVTYVDGSERHFHYEDSRFANHLTGITDEKNERFATWAYDDQGRAILSEHADGAERVEFAYNPDGTTTVTDANGAERTYHFTVQQGQIKVDHIEGDRCATCGNGGIKSYTYDDKGFVASRTDWNGNVTTYTRDPQGRELSRTEGAGTPEARTVTTTWDTELNKPLIVTEPERIIEYHYSSEGRMLSRAERPNP